MACPPAPPRARRRPSSSPPSAAHVSLLQRWLPWCFIEQNVSLVAPVGISHSCQARSEMAERGGSVRQQLRTLSGCSSSGKKKKKQPVESGLKMFFLKSTCSENVPEKFIKRIVFLCAMASFWVVWEMKKLLAFHSRCSLFPRKRVSQLQSRRLFLEPHPQVSIEQDELERVNHGSAGMTKREPQKKQTCVFGGVNA